jgi:regulator of cell morphogenesis and NO signaling
MRSEETRITSDMTLAEVLRVKRGATMLFDDIGVDYACGGGTSVKAAAPAIGLTANELVGLLRASDSRTGTDWFSEPLADLTRHLTRDHQSLIVGLLPRVRSALDAAIECHGHLALLNRMGELVDSLSSDIAEHATSEERELFPIVVRLEAAAASPEVEAPHTRISPRVLREFVEHETIRDRVHTLRDLTADLLLDCDIHVLASHLRAFQHHLHEHMHLENNVLYPRAIAIENGLRHAAQAASN